MATPRESLAAMRARRGGVTPPRDAEDNAATRPAPREKIAARGGPVRPGEGNTSVLREFGGELVSSLDTLAGKAVEGIRTSVVPSVIAGMANVQPAPAITERDRADFIRQARALTPAERKAAGIVPQDLIDPRPEIIWRLKKDYDPTVRGEEYREGVETLRRTAAEATAADTRIDAERSPTAAQVGEFAGTVAGDAPLFVLQPEIGATTAARFGARVTQRLGSEFAGRVAAYLAKNGANVPLDVVAGGIDQLLKTGELHPETMSSDAAIAFTARNVLGLISGAARRVNDRPPRPRATDVADSPSIVVTTAMDDAGKLRVAGERPADASEVADVIETETDAEGLIRIRPGGNDGGLTPPPRDGSAGAAGDGGPLVQRPAATNAARATVDPYERARAYSREMTARREAARGGEDRSIRRLLREAKAGIVDANAPIEDPVHEILSRGGAGVPPPPPAVTAARLTAYAPQRAIEGETVPRLSGEVESIARPAGGGFLPSEDITNAIDRSIMSGEIAGQFLRDGGMDRVIQTVADVDDLDQYATAKHAITLFYQRWGKFVDDYGGLRRKAYEAPRDVDVPLLEGRVPAARRRMRSSPAADARLNRLTRIYRVKFGRDLLEDAQMVQAFARDYEPAAQQLHAYSDELLNYSVGAGLVSPDLAQQLRKLYPFYVPLKRVFSVLEETASFGSGGPASLSRQTVVRKFEGSQREIESPLTSLIEKTYDAFAQGERNKAARLLASYADLPGNPLEIRELKSGEDSAHTFSFLDGGKKRTFATRRDVADAAKALNVEQMSLLGRVMAVPARVLKVGATGLNLAFLAKNPVRDVPTAIINSPQGFKVLSEVGRAIFEAVNHGQLYDEVMRQGGMFTSFDQFRNASREGVAAIRSRASAGARAKYLVRHPSELFRAVEDIVSRGEQATRLAVYSATKRGALERGLPEAEAQIAAKRASLWVTGPFHRRGEWGNVLRAAAPYLNAGIQGQRVTVSALADRPAQTFAKVTATTLLPAAVATAWNLSDPDRRAAYDSIETFEKENNIIIVPPDPTQDEDGLWNVIKIPLPQGVAKWVTLMRRPMEAAAELDPVRFGEVAHALIGTVSPISSASEVGSNVVPQAVKPALETTVNKNFFTRRDIVPPFMNDDPPEEQAFPETSGTARTIGRITGLSPLDVQHLVRGYGAGVGMQLLNGSDRVLAALGLIPEEQIGGEGPIEMTKRGFTKAVPKRE